MYYQSITRREPTGRVWWVAGSALAAVLLMAVLIAAAYATKSEPDRMPAGDAARPAPVESAAAEPEADSGDATDAQDRAGEPDISAEPHDGRGDGGEPAPDGSTGNAHSENGDDGSKPGPDQRRLTVITDDPNALEEFLDQWHGEVLASVDPADADQPGVPAYLITFDGAAGDESQLAAGVQQLEEAAMPNLLRISDDIELGGVVAGERGDGPQVAEQEDGGSDAGSDDGASCSGSALTTMAVLAYRTASELYFADDSAAGDAFSDLGNELSDRAQTCEVDDAGEEGEEAE